MSAPAHIQLDGDGNWSILENGEVRATYPGRAIRLSVISKTAVRDRESSTDNLTLDRITAIFTADLGHRGVDSEMPSDPLADAPWILLLQRIYADRTDFSGKQQGDLMVTFRGSDQVLRGRRPTTAGHSSSRKQKVAG